MTTLPAVRVVRHASRGFVPVLGWFLAIIVAVFLIIGTAMAVFGTVDASVWQFAGAGGFQYFPMALAIMFTPVIAPMYVTHGVTRHQVIAAGAMLIGVFAAVMAVIVWLGYAVEALIYRIGDLPHEFELPHLFGTWANFPLVFAEYFLLIAAGLAGGWLIGTLYYRLHWFWATILIPVAAIPYVAVEVLLQTSWFGEATVNGGWGWSRPPLGILIPLALVIIGVGIAANHILIRNVDIKVT